MDPEKLDVNDLNEPYELMFEDDSLLPWDDPEFDTSED